MADASISNPTIRVRHKTFDVSIMGKTITTVVTTEAVAVTAWIDEIRSLDKTGGAGAHVVGFDIERSFSNERSNRKHIGILQLCVGTRCLIYQIRQRTTPIPRALNEFLSELHNFFAGVRVKSKLKKLVTEFGIGEGARHLELGEMAADHLRRPDLKKQMMRELAIAVLGKTAEKQPLAVAACRWDKFELTEMEVLYAIIDPFLAHEIGTVLLDEFIV